MLFKHIITKKQLPNKFRKLYAAHLIPFQINIVTYPFSLNAIYFEEIRLTISIIQIKEPYQKSGSFCLSSRLWVFLQNNRN